MTVGGILRRGFLRGGLPRSYRQGPSHCGAGTQPRLVELAQARQVAGPTAARAGADPGWSAACSACRMRWARSTPGQACATTTTCDAAVEAGPQASSSASDVAGSGTRSHPATGPLAQARWASGGRRSPRFCALAPPRHRVLVIVGTFVASVLDLIGLTMMVPFIIAATSGQESTKGLVIALHSVLAHFGVPFAPLPILAIIIGGLTLKAIVGVLVTTLRATRSSAR